MGIVEVRTKRQNPIFVVKIMLSDNGNESLSVKYESRG
jgi:hypothetical protein